MESESLWQIPPESIVAQHDEVHVWRVFLNNAPTWVQTLSQVLSVDERQRAERIRLQRARQDFIVTRALLRILIGRYLRENPHEIRFNYGTNGKPKLAEDNDQALRFNLSHSQGLALYAVTLGRNVGIDVECVRSDDSIDAGMIAERFFSSQEIAALKSLPVAARLKAFFTCWTRKEAYLKARGDGLSMALDSFSVSLQPGEPAAVLNVSSDPNEIVRWSLADLNPDSRYAGAIAVEGHDWRIKCWQLTGDMQELPPYIEKNNSSRGDTLNFPMLENMPARLPRH